MTYRELTMIDITEVLRRWTAGQSARHIARNTGSDRKTVGRYVTAATELGLGRGRDVTESQVHEVGQRVQARTPMDPSAERQEISRHRALIEGWLGQKRPLRLRKMHTLLVRDHGVTASYATLRRFALDELGWHKPKPTIRLDDTPPGKVAQIDFGKMGLLRDEQSGRARVLWALIITLVRSRYQFVWPSFEQSTHAVCAGLDAAWRFFGAMPEVIIPDNMKAIIKHPDALACEIVPAFLDYAQARVLFVDPARVRTPKDKARVENQVPYVRESWFDGEVFRDLDDARKHAEHWCRDIAGMRVHGTTCEVPRMIFEQIEQPVMKPPPDYPFDVPIWTDAKVHPDHHIQIARALYSVPTRFIGKTVRVRADHLSVKIYLGTELIKLHVRVAPGRRSTDTNDYPTGLDTYATRSVDALLVRAREHGEHVGTYAERLLDIPLPWTRMRRVQELLRLCDKFGNGRVEAVCQSALSFDVVDVSRIGRMLRAAMQPATPGIENKVVRITEPRFARDQQHFVTVRKLHKEGA